MTVGINEQGQKIAIIKDIVDTGAIIVEKNKSHDDYQNFWKMKNRTCSIVLLEADEREEAGMLKRVFSETYFSFLQLHPS